MNVSKKQIKGLNSRGFSAVEVIVVILVIAAIVGVGSYIYSKHKTAHAAGWTKIGTVYTSKHTSFKIYGCVRYSSMSYSNSILLRAYATDSAGVNPGTSYRLSESLHQSTASTNSWWGSSSAPVSIYTYYGYGSPSRVTYTISEHSKGISSTITTPYYNLDYCN